MSRSEDRPPAGPANDEYGWIDRYAADLHRSAKELVTKGEAARVSDEEMKRIREMVEKARKEGAR
jgi:hypothetical protein